MIKIMIIVLFCLFVYSLIGEEVSARRSGPVIGGWTQQNIENNSALENVTQFAVNMYNQRSNSIVYKKLLKLKEARTQVVAGLKYFIRFEIGETDCRKNANQVTQDSCQIIETDTMETCNATIWERKWLNDIRLLSIDCQQL